MAVGFEDGSIMVYRQENFKSISYSSFGIISIRLNNFLFFSYRGDLTRERKNKIKVLKDTNTSITGLAIKSTGKQNYLFVATTNSVFLYNITMKDKEIKSNLDNMGCARKCSILAESKQDNHFMIGRDKVRNYF